MPVWFRRRGEAVHRARQRRTGGPSGGSTFSFSAVVKRSCKDTSSDSKRSLSEALPTAFKGMKVQEVIKVVEKELGFGEGQLLHKLCKVYLFISGQRVVGCLVVEPIRAAHKVIPSSPAENCSELTVSKTESGKTSHTLEFGKISFKREVLRQHNHSDKNKEECQGPSAIICEEEVVPALWVVPSG